MTLDQMLPAVTALPLQDREKLVEVLTEQAKKERDLLERVTKIGPIEFWSQFDCFETAAALQEFARRTTEEKHEG